MSEHMLITSETKVGALLETYPTLEDILIAQAPAFQKLKNPVLRRTVAKIATLERVAEIGGIEVRQLVNVLREAVGQPLMPQATTDPALPDIPSDAPDWVTEGETCVTFDADDYLSRGEHPLAHVMASAKELIPGQMIQLISSFRPAPLLEKMQTQGYRVFCTQRGENQYVTYIRN